MENNKITEGKSGIGSSEMPYGQIEFYHWLNLWLPNTTIGLDTFIQADGAVVTRIMGRTVDELP